MKIPRALLVAATSWVSRIVTGLSSLVVVRLLIENLGKEQYALFALVAGLLGWYSLADFGLGLALQNAISERRARSQSHDGLVRGTSLLAFALLAFVLLSIAIVAGPISAQYLVQFDLDAGTKHSAFWLGSSLLATSTVGAIAYRVWFAEQRGHLANMVPAIASLSGLGIVEFASKFGGGLSLIGTFLALQGPPALLGMAALSSRAFRRTGTVLADDFKAAREILHRAGAFWRVAVIAAASIHVDSFVVSQYLGPTDIIAYSVPTRVFDAIKLFYNAVLFALWPGWAELNANRDLAEIRRNVRSALKIGLLGTGMSGLLAILLMPYLLRVIAPGIEAHVPWTFIALLAVFELIRTWTNTHSTALGSMSAMRGIAISLVWQAVLSIGLQLLLVPRFGIHGATLGLIGSYLGAAAWVFPFLFYRRTRPAP